MNEVSVIGIDLAKSVFELCAQSATGEIVWRKRLKRKAFMRFMEEKAPRCLVGMEACGGEGSHVEDGADGFASAADGAFALMLAAIAIEGSQADEGGDLLAVELSELGDVGHEGGHVGSEEEDHAGAAGDAARHRGG